MKTNLWRQKSRKVKKKEEKNCEKFVKTWRVTQLLLFVLYYWKVGERDGLTFSGEFIWKKFYPGTVNQNLEFYSEIVGEKSRPVFVKFMFYKKAIFSLTIVLFIMSMQNAFSENMNSNLPNIKFMLSEQSLGFELIEKVATWNGDLCKRSQHFGHYVSLCSFCAYKKINSFKLKSKARDVWV